MNTLKGWISTTVVAMILMASTMTADAGVIIANRDACQEPMKIEVKDDLVGIIIANATGIIIANVTGIIIANATDEIPTQNCGIIIAN